MDVLLQIEAPLRAVNPEVRLIRERYYRRIENELSELGHALASSPLKPLRVSRDLVANLKLLPDSVTNGPETNLLLFTDPHDRGISTGTPGEILRHYWESLFAESVERHCLALTDNAWERLDPVLQIEVAFLLAAEHLVPQSPTPTQLFAAFAAEFLRTFYFRPSTLESFFPTVPREKVLTQLGAIVDHASLFSTTRPVGADAPRDVSLSHVPPPIRKPAEAPHRAAGFAASAEHAAAVGNDARAAILREKAALASSAGAARHYKMARESLADHLVPRLARVLQWDAEMQQRWTNALQPVLMPATLGIWPAGAKALYDLQKVAIDLDQELYAVDPASWFRSFGRRPMLRKLGLSRRVILLLHLVRVQRHLMQTPLAEGHRLALEHLLEEQIHSVDRQVRDEMAPLIRQAFDKVGFVPTSPTETVARDKVVQELLDIACERGQIRLGDLRDAIARNRLKLPDLAGPVEFLTGDILLRADAELDRLLDGVYVRGETYLRVIQRGSAVAFGTTIGRALSLFVFGPLIASFLIVEFSKYLAHELTTVYKLIRSLVRYSDDTLEIVEGDDGEVAVAWASELAHQEKHGISFGTSSLIAGGILTLVILGLIHSPPFRAAVLRGLSLFWQGFVWTLGLPFRLWRCSTVLSFRRHPLVRGFWNHFGLAVLATLGTTLFLTTFDASPRRTLEGAVLAFVITALFQNSWFGRWFTEEADEMLSESWRQVRVNLLPNALSWVLWLFRELLGAIDRMLYAVDEWLRFRGGQSKPSLVLKVATGLIWFPIAYVLRFVIHLFIEPQINPVKHFPVVTVSHKLLLPLIPTLAPTVAAALQISEEKSFGLLTVVIGCIPGMFGFIAWELKENWRLYAANRPRRLQPVSLGHHGESMRGLLRPGFHSGTIPACYRKIRAAIRYADQTGTTAGAGKALDGLHHVDHAIHTFIERELFALLRQANGWTQLHLETSAVRLGLQSVTIEVNCTAFPKKPAVMIFTHVGGVVSGLVVERGFLKELMHEQQAVWDTAVTGIFALGAVPIPETDLRTGWQEWNDFWVQHTVKTANQSPA